MNEENLIKAINNYVGIPTEIAKAVAKQKRLSFKAGIKEEQKKTKPIINPEPIKEGDWIEIFKGEYAGEIGTLFCTNKNFSLIKIPSKNCTIGEKSDWQTKKWVPFDKYDKLCKEHMKLLFPELKRIK